MRFACIKKITSLVFMINTIFFSIQKIFNYEAYRRYLNYRVIL